MNTIISIVMAISLATSVGVTGNETTRYTTFSYFDDTVYVREETNWMLGGTSVKDYEMTYDEWINR